MGGSLVGTVFGLVGLAGITAGSSTTADHWTGWVLFVFGGLFVWRSLRSGTVVATASELRVGTFARDYHIPFTDIARVTADARAVGPMGWRRSCLVVERNDGSRKVFTDVNSPLGKNGDRSDVEIAAEEINRLAHTAALRRGPLMRHRRTLAQALGTPVASQIVFSPESL
jgi:hypothetical protein